MYRRLCAGMAVAAFVLFMAPAFAGVQDFYVRNYGKFAVFYIFVSPDYSDDWEEDVLGSEVLMPGEELEITMHGYGNHCFFDIYVEDERGNYREYWGVDLCSVLYVDFP
ncbi:MAG: hypothetical protein AAF563_08240 [Pseudomonadota bacterium]